MADKNQKVRVGEEVTLIRLIEVPYQAKYKPVFLRVTKVGRKYLHGRVNWFDPQEGRIVETHVFDSQWDMSDYQVVSKGFNLELYQKWTLHDMMVSYHRNKRDSAYGKIEREADRIKRTTVNLGMKAWDLENPVPLNPMLEYVEIKEES